MMFDGQQNTIDELLIDIPVTLFDENNVELASTVTDADGSYLFDNLIVIIGMDYKMLAKQVLLT